MNSSLCTSSERILYLQEVMLTTTNLSRLDIVEERTYDAFIDSVLRGQTTFFFLFWGRGKFSLLSFCTPSAKGKKWSGHARLSPSHGFLLTKPFAINPPTAACLHIQTVAVTNCEWRCVCVLAVNSVALYTPHRMEYNTVCLHVQLWHLQPSAVFIVIHL